MITDGTLWTGDMVDPKSVCTLSKTEKCNALAGNQTQKSIL
jgi:hypothetical protein